MICSEFQRLFASAIVVMDCIWQHQPKSKSLLFAMIFGKQIQFYGTICMTRNCKLLMKIYVHSQFMNEMIGELYLTVDMPEPPKESFFKGLFGGGARNLDREELC